MRSLSLARSGHGPRHGAHGPHSGTVVSHTSERRMANAESSLCCPICADVFSDPVALPCGHIFCRSCIRAVWNMEDGSDGMGIGPDDGGGTAGAVAVPGPFFCPECQILLPPDVQLQPNAALQNLIQEAMGGQNRSGTEWNGQNRGAPEWNGQPSAAGLDHQVTALAGEGAGPAVTCDHCIERVSVAVRSCLTCDAALCLAHAQAHQRKAALRRHTLVEPSGDLLPYRCREHGEELRLYCAEDCVAVCSLCAAVGTHRGHRVVSLQEATADLKVSRGEERRGLRVR